MSYDYGANFDEYNEIRTVYTNTDIAFSPRLLWGGQLLWHAVRPETPSGVAFDLEWATQHVSDQYMDHTATLIRERTDRPIVLFPGAPSQLTAEADALLFLSVISSRNPEALIGKHVEAAPRVRELGLDPVGCGYLLIDGGRTTTAHYMSGSLPIPADKPDIAAATALAGHCLGMQCMYLDTGSGADRAVPAEMIAAVRRAVPCPVIVGGGLRTPDAVMDAWAAGADLAVVGSAIERDPNFLRAFAATQAVR